MRYTPCYDRSARSGYSSKTISPTALAMQTAIEHPVVSVLESVCDGVVVGLMLGSLVAGVNVLCHLLTKD